MDGQVKARYQVRVSRQDDWWLARVLAASDGADSAPLNALTQARSLARIEPMARDLIATIIDADERTFDVELEYLLPDDASELVCQAHGARAWLDEAQDLWQERSTIAVRQLADRGYSLRETATLLGLSYQRVDQILGSHADLRHSDVLVFPCTSNAGTDGHLLAEDAIDIEALLVIRQAGSAPDSSCIPARGSALEARFRQQVNELLTRWVSLMSEHSSDAELEVGVGHSEPRPA
jgi:hypothetical protein